MPTSPALRRSWFAAMMLALVSGGCGARSDPAATTATAALPEPAPTTTVSPSTAPPSPPLPPTTGTPPPTRPSPDPVPAPSGLVIRGTDGVLRTASDGVLVERTGGSAAVVQPTWGPDGARLAWVELDPDGTSRIIVSTDEESSPLRVSTPFPPFYLLWSPDGARLAFLGNNPVTLGLLDVEAGSIEIVDEGTPFYFDWAPDSQNLVTHVGAGGIHVGAPGSATRLLAPDSTAFLAPEWTPDGTAVVYVAPSGGGAGGISAAAGGGPIAQPGARLALVVHDLATDETVEVVEFSGRISFSIAPDGSRIAFAVTDGGEAISFGPLETVDLSGADRTTISPRPVIAFEWAPSSEQLAFLVPSEDAASVQWGVGDGNDVQLFAPILPSAAYVQEYLPFFDQYLRSMTRWAPDSSAIVFSVGAVGGDEIWLQPVDGSAPGLVGPGSIAAFPPRG